MIVPVAPGEGRPRPALESLGALTYPGPLEIIVADQPIAPAPAPATDKVHRLWAGVNRARHPVLVFWDADVQVPPGLLPALVHVLSRPQTGLSYALPCWTGARSGPGLLLQAWANAQVGTFLLPIVARARRPPVTGALVALRRQVLEEIGGMRALAGYLADDARLGEVVHRAGYRVVPCGWVRVVVGRCSCGAALSALLRWLLTLRHHTPAAYAVSFLTHWVPAALLWGAWQAARGHSPVWAWGPLAAVAGLRVWRATLPALRAGAPDPLAAVLAPLADVVAALLWPAPLFLRHVTWAGITYRLLGGGRVAPFPDGAGARRRGSRKRIGPRTRQYEADTEEGSQPS